MKSRPVEAKSFYTGEWAGGWTDGQTRIIKLTVAFHNFVHMPNK